MLSMSITIASKRVLFSQQFHVKYGEPFSLTFKDDEETFTIRFIQKIDAPETGIVPFLKVSKPSPYLREDKVPDQKGLYYVLGNFNQTKITTNPIPFYSKGDSLRYYFQLSAMSISEKVDDPETIWLYTVTIYEKQKI